MVGVKGNQKDHRLFFLFLVFFLGERGRLLKDRPLFGEKGGGDFQKADPKAPKSTNFRWSTHHEKRELRRRRQLWLGRNPEPSSRFLSVAHLAGTAAKPRSRSSAHQVFRRCFQFRSSPRRVAYPLARSKRSWPIQKPRQSSHNH